MRDTSSIQAVAFDVDGTLYSEPALYARSLPFAIAHRRTIARFRAVRAQLHDLHADADADVSDSPADVDASALPTDADADASPADADAPRDFLADSSFGPYAEPPLVPSAAPADSLWRRQAFLFAERMGVSFEDGYRELGAVIYTQWIEQICRMPLLPDVVRTLELLRARGIPVAALSDFPPLRKLERWGIASYFTAMHNSEVCRRLKPHPRPFRELARSLALPPSAILYVGNNPRYDILPARALGFRTAYYDDPLFRALRRSRRSRRRLGGASSSHSASRSHRDIVFSHYRQLYSYIDSILS